MEHGGELITTIALGLSAAFVAGLIARRLRLPSIVGYLLAGVALGPFTPGLIANQEIATELAEIGVILLMFGVGIHFSFRDLLAVRGIAIPARSCRAPWPPGSASAWRWRSDGASRRGSCSASRCRWRAPSSCCGR